jgi:hypothetical protein
MATTRFSIQPDVESFSGGGHIRVKIEAATPEVTHPSPLTHQGGVAEQCGLDRKHIEASHVAARFSSLEHQHLQFVSGHIARIRHGAIVAERANAVQRKL